MDPWHTGLVFASVLALALMFQVIYFRTKQWKVRAITQERERLALEIHDTMAQSFAGIGYQIQGIRSAVVRDNSQDSGRIAGQLEVAYQLVRRCHEEASQTIAMLGSSVPDVQNNLLEALAETAHKIAADSIRTVAETKGSATPLNLRLANALLHIGQEAIANAVGHSAPTVLTLTLHYEEGCVELIVADNGRGFHYSHEKAGFGILGMQKRARDVAGSLRIVSVPGFGTQVHVLAKLQNKGMHKGIAANAKEAIRSFAIHRQA